MTQRDTNTLAIAGILALGIVCLGLTVNAALTFLDRPVVYRDALSGECLGVESPDGRFTCSRLPLDYDSVTVAPRRLNHVVL